MKKHRMASIAWGCMGVILAVIAVLAMVLFYTVQSDSAHEYLVSLNLVDDTLSDDKGIQITLEHERYWINDEGMETESVGAEYTGTISNELVSDIYGWKLIMELPKGSVIDSFSDGKYEVDGSKLVITPNENTDLIPSEGRRTFGFVVLSKEAVKFSEVQFVCMRKVSILQYELFWGLFVAFVVWIVVSIVLVISGIRTKHFNEIRENDAKIISQTMQVFAGFIDAKDEYTKGHSVRVSMYAKELGRRMKLPEDEVVKLGYVGLMHDCGKIGVPDDVLTKPQGLGSDERLKIKEHTVMGGKILEGFTAINGIRDGALYHHECYDGTGYPEGLKGKEIPLYARIICVADAYDAMSTNRCYRNRLTQADIVKELEAGRGTQFDPEIVTHMINMIDEGCCQIDDGVY